MAAVVRTFFFDAIVAAPSTGKTYTTDSVGILNFPYMDRTVVTATTGSAQNSGAAPAKTKIALVQVQSGKSVHIEVNPPNRSTAADTSSPIFRGDNTFVVHEGYTLSILEAS